MYFERRNDGRYQSATNDGRVIVCENELEAMACAELHCGIMRLLGHDCRVGDFIHLSDDVERSDTEPKIEKKRVIFRIDTEVEYLGDTVIGGIKEKALA